MSNKETLQGYNETLDQYNTNLDDILNTINNLPENENLTEELDAYNNEVTEQEATIDTILKTLQTKAIGGGGSMNNYSTEETVIGTWLGKPLYRKVFEFDVEAKTNVSFTKDELGISETEHIIINMGSSTALYYNPSRTKNGFSDISYYISDTDRAHVYINFDKTMTIQNQNQTPRKYYIVLEYTKKTD